MDKELDKMEFKLNGLTELYRVQTRQAVQSPLYLNTPEAFQKWNRFHRLTHKSTTLSHKSTGLPQSAHRYAQSASAHGVPWHILSISFYLEQEAHLVFITKVEQVMLSCH